jgi:hypothetical protein
MPSVGLRDSLTIEYNKSTFFYLKVPQLFKFLACTISDTGRIRCRNTGSWCSLARTWKEELMRVPSLQSNCFCSYPDPDLKKKLLVSWYPQSFQFLGSGIGIFNSHMVINAGARRRHLKLHAPSR